MAFDVRDDRIAAIHGVVNPEKLRHLGPGLGWPANLEALREAGQHHADGAGPALKR